MFWQGQTLSTHQINLFFLRCGHRHKIIWKHFRWWQIQRDLTVDFSTDFSKHSNTFACVSSNWSGSTRFIPGITCNCAATSFKYSSLKHHRSLCVVNRSNKGKAWSPLCVIKNIFVHSYLYIKDKIRNKKF